MKQPNISACHEVELHYKRPLLEEMPVLNHTNDSLSFINKHINTERIDFKECFWVILVTNANSALGYAKISEGTVTGTLINIREIIQLVLVTHASAVVLVHNHPSGKLEPSTSDINQTKKCKEALELIEARLLDHLIITSESYVSLMEENLL